jgi:hypothetical protein
MNGSLNPHLVSNSSFLVIYIGSYSTLFLFKISNISSSFSIFSSHPFTWLCLLPKAEDEISFHVFQKCSAQGSSCSLVFRWEDTLFFSRRNIKNSPYLPQDIRDDSFLEGDDLCFPAEAAAQLQSVRCFMVKFLVVHWQWDACQQLPPRPLSTSPCSHICSHIVILILPSVVPLCSKCVSYLKCSNESIFHYLELDILYVSRYSDFFVLPVPSLMPKRRSFPEGQLSAQS